MNQIPEESALDGENLELKARVESLETIRDLVVRAGAVQQGEERQVDHYFAVPEGRLKLRQSSADGAHLIFYIRPDGERFRPARFHRLPVENPAGLIETLRAMLGERAVVDKSRDVWWVDDVRIHLDEVEGQGAFIEFEARVDRIGDRDEAERRLEKLCRALGIEPQNILPGSYGEMVCQNKI